MNPFRFDITIKDGQLYFETCDTGQWCMKYNKYSGENVWYHIDTYSNIVLETANKIFRCELYSEQAKKSILTNKEFSKKHFKV